MNNPTRVIDGIRNPRRGSTLVIVIALLGLLSFTGMMIFTFSAQERNSAEYFSEAQKSVVVEEDDVITFAVEQLITGARESNIHSALYSPTRRHSLVSNLVGNDIHPFNGTGVHVIYEDDPNTPIAAAIPRVDLNRNGTANDEDGLDGSGVANGEISTQGLLEFADSPAFRANGVVQRTTLNPEPDVAYTYPDNNHLFLAYKGHAIRNNGVGANPQFEMVPVTIPSFFRPQYLKTSDTNGPGSVNVPTDLNWASDSADTTALGTRTRNFMGRSFRPHVMHRRFNRNGQSVPRYLTDAEAATPLINIGSGGFPFLPADIPGGTATRGELGIWTGSDPNVMELDVDNDGDGVLEGIWMDLDYPVQEMTDTGGNTHLYSVLHSMTVYDLDALININVHGNLALLPRAGTLPGVASSGALGAGMVSSSNLGLGPNEVNPIWALRRDDRNFNTLPVPGYIAGLSASASDQLQFTEHFNQLPASSLEQANMELMWLFFGRGQFDATASPQPREIFPGRWGEAERLYFALNNGLNIGDVPRPGLFGNAKETISTAGIVNFGGRGGYDDNQDSLEGEQQNAAGLIRPFGHPMDFQGTGKSVTTDYPQFDINTQQFTFTRTIGTDQFATDDLRSPVLANAGTTPGPGRWQSYRGYSVSSAMNTAFRRYMFGPDGVWNNGSGDDLSTSFFTDANFEDPMETIFYADLAQRPVDQIFSPDELFALQLTAADITKVQDNISLRLQQLAPFAFASSSDSRQKFTTLSSALRHFSLRSPYGGDLRPGLAGVDDDLDGVIDEPDEVLVTPSPDLTDDPTRFWEFNSDFDGDKNLEFPPMFGNGAVLPYAVDSTLLTPQDPFRPQIRRLLTMEIGERRSQGMQKPISLNHLVDVERNSVTPAENTPQFISFLRSSVLQLRSLTEHPHETVTGTLTANRTFTLANPAGTPDPANFSVLNETAVTFPPTTPAEQEFWARRDRQKLARDIFVLLYVTGGAAQDGVTPIVKDYTLTNDPDAAPGTAQSLYTHAQVRRMAQFAVNMVDAMDSDNVMTRFEYDKNLGNGWNLDDDPYTSFPRERPTTTLPNPTDAATAFGMYPEDTNDRGVVYGVEAQELAFSEVLGIRSPQITAGMTRNHVATPHDDDAAGRDHLFVELQNVLPTPVPLATASTTNANNAIWRLVRYDRTLGTEDHTTTNGFRTLCFLDDADIVAPEGRYTIASASDATVISSDFFVDHNLDNTYELIAPNVTPGMLPTTSTTLTDPNEMTLKPRCNLDLIHDDDVTTSRFTFIDDTGAEQTSTAAARGFFLETLNDYNGHPAGRLIELFNSAHFVATSFGGSEVGFDLVLQRRANPAMPSLENSAAQNTDVAEVNPWVEVDRISVVFRNFGIEAADTQTELEGTGRLLEVRSQERAEPLNDKTRSLFPVTPLPANFVLNSIGATLNDATDRASNVTPVTGVITIPGTSDGTGVFQLVQHHLDRDYASPGDLLNLPVVGGMLLTQSLNDSRLAPLQQIGGATGDPDLICGAAAMFLMPDFPNQSVDLIVGNPSLSIATSTAKDNRWYRLMQFVEVPSRTHRMLGEYLAQNRVPAKININMIRHREVLAGLLDNPMFAEMPELLDRTPFFAGAPPDPGNQFLDGPFLNDSTPGMVPLTPEADTWLRLMNDRDGLQVVGFDPVTAAPRGFWIPGTPNSQPFQSGEAQSDVQLDLDFNGTPDRVDGGIEDTLYRRSRVDSNLEDSDGDGIPGDGVAVGITGVVIPANGPADAALLTNRRSLELGSPAFHIDPDSQVNGFVMGSGPAQRHQMLSKILNNTTTVSNTFLVYVTAGYFESYEDPTTNLIRVGGRFDLDGNADPTNDYQREVLVIDRSELFGAYDSGTGSLDWRKLVKHRVKID
jgi:hypothetical protein